MPETQEIVVDGGGGSGRKPQKTLVQGTSAAGARALGAQLIAFYFRAPVKAFFRQRVDYMVSSHLSRMSDGTGIIANEGSTFLGL